MKKRILPLVLAGLMCLFLAACSGGGDDAADTTKTEAKTTEAPSAETDAPEDESADNGTSSDSDKELNVNVILKTTASEYWGYVVAGAESYQEEHPEVKVTVQGASSETAYDEQLNIIETNLGSNSYDGFVIAPLQAEMVMSKVSGVELPIIAVDTDIDAPEVLSFVGTGNEAAATEGGKAAVELAETEGWEEIKAIAISGVQGDSTATARLTGYKEGIESAGGEFLEDETQYADAVADKAFSSMEAVMQNHPEGIAIIVCNNDDMAMAAARAAADNEAYEKTIFVGFDGIQSACNAILDGEETLSVAQNAFEMGYKAVEACVKAINGEAVEEFIDSGNSIITADNAQEQLDTLKSYLG